jgi:hypothetical protein
MIYVNQVRQHLAGGILISLGRQLDFDRLN